MIPNLPGRLLPAIARTLSFWRLNLLGWLAVGAAVFLMRWAFHRDAPQAVIFAAFSGCLAFVVSLLLRPFYRSLSRSFQLRTAVLVAIFSLLASVAVAVSSHIFVGMTGWRSPHFTPLESTLMHVLLMWAVFMGWSFAYFWVKAERALRSETRIARKAGREARRMELRMLRAQLDPHFLFNSLNGIAAEIRPHPDAATRMLGELSDYLRYSLEHGKRAINPLSDELDAMRAYLEIEKARFGERLSVRMDVSSEARWRNVPGFLLQPLVENAIKHGLSNTRSAVDLSISARLDAGALVVEVSNTGHLASQESAREGLGIDTLRRRLDLHYPQRHVFELCSDGLRVSARLQLRGEPCSA